MDPRLILAAKRAVWWKPPEDVFASPIYGIPYVLENGLWEDCLTVEKIFGQETLKEALRQASPGILSIKAWNFWNLRLGLDLPRPVKQIPAYNESSSLP